ncbi:unnamed protein product [Rotaria sordida]|uniref:NAD(P)(+)--arginine ADP-ribosyltransferase n=1 Tax=Rotaria sordida TaxID=392033 RepID=A0A819VV07_9BILA|nr:unnamed protein product [Rotaria sordida]CAF4114341.1 unnamed protein product [Rotaria sordida]
MALEDENLESFSLVWLDEKGKDESNIEEQLRQCINHLKIFDDANNCELYIRSVHEGDGIVWVVNNHLGQMTVPCLHQLQQILSIYIFDTNSKIETEWTKKYPKVKGVINELSVLLKLIQMDHTRRGAKKIEEQLVLNVFNTSSSDEQSTTGLNGQFIHSQLLINCLLRMKAASTDKDEMISLSKKQYKDNKNELSIVHEFEENYSADRAIWWYTRESFLYRQLNKALRVQNIDLLFIFRFFIRDIQEQLEKHQCSSSIHVFRGQLMLNEELKLLKDSIGQLISMNSFLSTSTDRQLALSFLYSSTVVDNMQRILFEIDADPRLEGIRPFANITNLSYFPGEEEVLFMLGSIFRLVSIDQNDRGIWIVRLTLCNNNDPDLQAVFDYMKDQYGNGETTIHSLGLILAQMGKYDEAEKYYRRLLNDINPSNYEDISACYHNLGNLFDDKGDYESSLDWHHKALDIMKKIFKADDSRIATSYNSIAAVHSKMNNYDEALECYLKALKIWKQALGEEHPNIGQCLSNIAGIYQMCEKSSKALEYSQQALVIYQRYLPANHPQMGDLHNNIGVIHLDLHHLDLALEHLNMSLNIKKKCLPSQHPDIAMTLANIGLIYESKEEWQQAVSYLEKAVNIYRHVLYSNHPILLKVEQLLARVSSRSKMA